MRWAQKLWAGAVLSVLFVTGAGSMVLQVTWQRMVTLHNGVDLSSSTIVVSVVLAGLGIGSLIGGRVADRAGQRRALGCLALTSVFVGLYAFVSPWLLYDLYPAQTHGLGMPVVSALFYSSVLGLPTVMMGMSLPLAAAATIDRTATAGASVGRLTAANTLGAAVGAIVGGWYLVGANGFVGTTRLVAAAELLVATTLLLLQRIARRAQAAPGRVADVARPAVIQHSGSREGADWPAWVWYLIYACSGAVALGFEQVFFRLIDGTLRSNSYTFAHVLALYLGLWAAGAAVGSYFVARIGAGRQVLLGLLFFAGVAAVATLTLFVHVVPEIVLQDRFAAWFGSTGMRSGILAGDLADQFLFGLAVPLGIMALPVMTFGAAFPFAQSLVSRDLGTIGRSTGRLQFANLAGNIAGALLASFVLVEQLGTAGAYLALMAPAVVAGVAAALLSPTRRRAVTQSVGVAGVALLAVATAPTNLELWARLHGTSPQQMLLAEDRSCASAATLDGHGNALLHVNGAAQNNYPFDEFHLLVGLLPSLVADEGGEGLAIGYGIGSTSFAMLSSERLRTVTTVELCGGNYTLTERLGQYGASEMQRLHRDPTHRMLVGDGRRHLVMADDARYSVIVPDTVLPTSAGSNNVYSKEFFELAAQRLTPSGILSIWVATNRVLNAATTVFPHVVMFDVDSYNDSTFVMASRSPIPIDPTELLRRFDRIGGAFEPKTRVSLRSYLAALRAECVNDGRTAVLTSSGAENRDLRPRDEYFLNNPAALKDQVVRTC